MRKHKNIIIPIVLVLIVIISSLSHVTPIGLKNFTTE